MHEMFEYISVSENNTSYFLYVLAVGSSVSTGMVKVSQHRTDRICTDTQVSDDLQRFAMTTLGHLNQDSNSRACQHSYKSPDIGIVNALWISGSLQILVVYPGCGV